MQERERRSSLTRHQWLIGMLIDRFYRPAVLMPFYCAGISGLWLPASAQALVRHVGNVSALHTGSSRS